MLTDQSPQEKLKSLANAWLDKPFLGAPQAQYSTPMSATVHNTNTRIFFTCLLQRCQSSFRDAQSCEGKNIAVNKSAMAVDPTCPHYRCEADAAPPTASSVNLLSFSA